jgi:hypothetical protein
MRNHVEGPFERLVLPLGDLEDATAHSTSRPPAPAPLSGTIGEPDVATSFHVVADLERLQGDPGLCVTGGLDLDDDGRDFAHVALAVRGPAEQDDVSRLWKTRIDVSLFA